MRHIKIEFTPLTNELRDILIASLADEGYEGFEETEAGLLAYIPEDDYNYITIDELARQNGIKFTVEVIEPVNWNETWEKNFDPVIVEGFCTVRADFHNIPVNTPYEIIITPKMSFGTGHHATTQLVMEGMKEIDFKNKKVLDFGTGTGILAILASMLGAKEVVAIDNDEWSVANSIENASCNNISNVSISLGELTSVPEQEFDIILANINRHILLDNMTALYRYLVSGGTLLLSGLLQADEEIIKTPAIDNGFEYQCTTIKGDWIAIKFVKK
jgi:ribosomal protein L11 methyltransferase